MAATWEKFLAQARTAKHLANKLRDVRAELRLLAECHAFNGFSAANDEPAPAFMRKDDSGNIKGLDFNAADYLKVIEFASDIETLVSDAQKGYRAALERIADPGQGITT